jgi:hypothetical protein
LPDKQTIIDGIAVRHIRQAQPDLTRSFSEKAGKNW